MAKKISKSDKTKSDVLAQPIGIEARLKESGVFFKIRSRFASALDRLGGSKMDRKAAAEEDQAVVLRAQSEAKKVLITKAAEVLAAELECYPDLALAVLSGNFDEAYRRHQNRNSVLEKAAEELIAIAPKSDKSPEEIIQEDELDPDWLNQFYEYTAMASSEDLQTAFARILAGECVKPGTFAKRTLRALCELDREAARAFQLIARYRDAEDVHIAHPPQEAAVPYRTIVDLDDAGLIANVPGVGFALKPDDKGYFGIVNGDRTLITRQNINDTRFKFDIRVDVYTITRFGRDLVSVFPKERPDIYLDAIAENLKKNEDITELKKADILKINKDLGTFSTGNEIIIYMKSGNTED